MYTLSSINTKEGRSILRNLYDKLRFEEQKSVLNSLSSTLSVAINPSKLQQYDSDSPEIAGRPGTWGGFTIWMEEIINRNYYSTINSLVYLGAAILLVIVGLTRFTDSVGTEWVVGGIIFESFLLLLVFITMYFSPPAVFSVSDSDSLDSDMQSELLDEIGEIGRDLAAVSVQFDKISKQLESHNYNTSNLVAEMRKISIAVSDISSPNPEMLIKMAKTNEELNKFNENLGKFSIVAEKLSSKIIEDQVRTEISKILESRINGQDQK
jgi:hypothetical protein